MINTYLAFAKGIYSYLIPQYDFLKCPEHYRPTAKANSNFFIRNILVASFLETDPRVLKRNLVKVVKKIKLSSPDEKLIIP